jgi:hypothetical protein
MVDLDKVDMATGNGVSKKMSTDEIVEALRGMRSEKIVTNLYGTKTKADGVIIKNVKDALTNNTGDVTDVYIPFSNEQVKNLNPKTKANETTTQADTKGTQTQQEAPAKAKSKLAAFREKRFGKKPEPTVEQPKMKSKEAVVRSINELKAEVELMKRGKKSPEKDAKIAEFEREIEAQEKLGIHPDKGRTVGVDEIETDEKKPEPEPKAPQPEGPKRPVKLGSKEYKFIGVNNQGEDIYEND